MSGKDSAMSDPEGGRLMRRLSVAMLVFGLMGWGARAATPGGPQAERPADVPSLAPQCAHSSRSPKFHLTVTAMQDGGVLWNGGCAEAGGTVQLASACDAGTVSFTISTDGGLFVDSGGSCDGGTAWGSVHVDAGTYIINLPNVRDCRQLRIRTGTKGNSAPMQTSNPCLVSDADAGDFKLLKRHPHFEPDEIIEGNLDVATTKGRGGEEDLPGRPRGAGQPPKPRPSGRGDTPR